MRPPKIKITVPNHRIFKGKMYLASFKLQDRSSVHKDLYATWFSERWVMNFLESGRVYTRWAPLAESTKEDRAKMGIGRDRPKLNREGGDYSAIGVDDVGGQLFDDFVTQIDENVFYSKDITNWDFVNMPPHYALSHHFGFQNPNRLRAPIPSRILWDINNTDKQEVHDRFLKYILHVLSSY